MRALVVVAILLGSVSISISTAAAQRRPLRPTLAVIGVEAVAPPRQPGQPTPRPNADTIALANEIASLLKARIAWSDSSHRVVDAKRDFATLRAAANCPNEEPYCMLDIAALVGAENILYGKVEQVGNGHRITITLIEALMRSIQVHVEVLEGDAAKDIALARWVEATYPALVASKTAGVPLPPPVRRVPHKPVPAPAKHRKPPTKR